MTLAERLGEKLHVETIKRHGDICWPGTKFVEALVDEALEEAAKVADTIMERELATHTHCPLPEEIADEIRALKSTGKGERENDDSKVS